MAAPPKTLDAEKAPAALAALAIGKGEEAPRLTRDSADLFLARLHVGLCNLHTSAAGALRWRAAENPDLTENPLWRLSPIITLAPLLGLLSTVERIMQPFHLSGGSDPASDPHSRGIAGALIATAPGLFIATLYLLALQLVESAPGATARLARTGDQSCGSSVAIGTRPGRRVKGTKPGTGGHDHVRSLMAS